MVSPCQRSKEAASQIRFYEQEGKATADRYERNATLIQVVTKVAMLSLFTGITLGTTLSGWSVFGVIVGVAVVILPISASKEKAYRVLAIEIRENNEANILYLKLLDPQNHPHHVTDLTPVDSRLYHDIRNEGELNEKYPWSIKGIDRRLAKLGVDIPPSSYDLIARRVGCPLTYEKKPTFEEYGVASETTEGESSKEVKAHLASQHSKIEELLKELQKGNCPTIELPDFTKQRDRSASRSALLEDIKSNVACIEKLEAIVETLPRSRFLAMSDQLNQLKRVAVEKHLGKPSDIPLEFVEAYVKHVTPKATLYAEKIAELKDRCMELDQTGKFQTKLEELTYEINTGGKNTLTLIREGVAIAFSPTPTDPFPKTGDRFFSVIHRNLKKQDNLAFRTMIIHRIAVCLIEQAPLWPLIFISSPYLSIGSIACFMFTGQIAGYFYDRRIKEIEKKMLHLRYAEFLHIHGLKNGLAVKELQELEKRYHLDLDGYEMTATKLIFGEKLASVEELKAFKENFKLPNFRNPDSN
ncbi:MAG: hypothetical protein S4CHLAM45_10110 [Chlamydiales bacterium]|nr:hypothetical protein [Chlamydiales bacterium]MCH9620173.1 hypothetical protein [Chlamydiales bacterium]MCH9623112.1 hypothetical protein [Chlamydiales bacterium]